jgi:glycogen operon protein
LPPRIGEGSPGQLGARPDKTGTNFALFSAHAEAVDLCLFDPDGLRERERIRLPRRTGDVWHGRVAGIEPGQLYGYRVHGPYDPGRGHRFNPNKLLVDPYARELRGGLVWDEAVYGFDTASPDRDLSFDPRDSAASVPKGAVVDSMAGAASPPLRRPWSETVIYEAHVKGLTWLHPAIPEPIRGTYEALGHPAVVEHLSRLGVTALELLPIQAFVDDRFLVRRGLVNYWGYSTLNFFAPEPRYLGPTGPDGLREAVRRLHEAGIEVILDIVFNHTCEAEEIGPTLSFRGLDNASYYKLEASDPRRYVNVTGCGNTLDLAHPQVTRMAVDCLRHWVESYGIDGFRFDLAAALARNPRDFDPGAPFLTALAAEPALAGVKLIAEPWDIGEGGYRLGQFLPPWREWNDVFRDGVRRFWRGDPGSVPGMARALSGSREVFERSGRSPTASINYVCSHDGYTLADLVSYEDRHNWANGEENRDGHGDSHSRNYGQEGPSDDPAVVAVRARQMRNLAASIFLARGVPMLLMGDEWERSQGGNNNAYCQDNATTWLRWPAEGVEPTILAFIKRIAELRRAHLALTRDAFFQGEKEDGSKDVVWLAPDGREMGVADWEDPSRLAFGMLFGTEPGDGEPLLLLLNAAVGEVAFTLPASAAPWRTVLHTTEAEPRPDTPDGRGTILLGSRSLVLLSNTYQRTTL